MQPHPNQPHKSMYNNTIARARKDSQGQRRNCRMSAASQAPHIPRAMRIAERDAEYRQHQSPNRGSQTAQPASSDWHESKNMREGPPSSKESKSPRCNGQHSGCRRRRPMLPYMLPLRQPSLLLLLGWPPVRLVLIRHWARDGQGPKDEDAKEKDASTTTTPKTGLT